MGSEVYRKATEEESKHDRLCGYCMSKLYLHRVAIGSNALSSLIVHETVHVVLYVILLVN